MTSSAEDRVKGNLNKAAGKAKEVTGDAVNNRSLENEGKAQQVKGHAQDAKGKIKDALDDE